MIERSYNVPLRKEYMKVPRQKRAKKASTALRQFIVKHMKSEDVVISNAVNEKIWAKGIRNPPHHVLVDVVKDDEGKVTVSLPEEKVKKEKKEKKQTTKKKESKKSEKKKEEKTEKKSKKKPSKK